jgi:Tol biopolymer transport system component
VARASRLSTAVALVALAVVIAFLPPARTPAAFPGTNGKIAFHSNRNGNVEIYSMNADGTGQRRLTNDSDADRAPNYSASGHLIVFERSSDEGPEIWIMGADGVGETRIARRGDDPALSPDGRRIAFRSSRDGNQEIYVMDADGSDPKRLTNQPTMDGGPAWSPDGRKIAFHSGRDGNPEIYVMNPDGSNQTRLTNNRVTDLDPSWAPDGSRIAFERVTAGSNTDIGVMNADGSGEVRLTNDPAADLSPAWAPDGTKIAFTTFRDGNFEIYVMNSDGSGQANVSANPAVDSRPDWAVVPDEKTLADLPPPAIGKTANVAPRGRVLLGVRGRGARIAQKGVRFVPLREARQIPVGSFVDTRRGSVRLQTATKTAGKRQSGVFLDGVIQVLQARRGKSKGLTSLRLKGASFARCPSAASSRRATAAASVIRRLRARARGRFRTRGRHSAATVRGTTWVTADRCDGTLTRVTRGRVAVSDFRRRRNVLVRAGKSYLARAP